MADMTSAMYLAAMRMIGLSLVLATILPAACSKLPVRQTTAVVVNIAPGRNGRWDTDKVQVTARSLDGLIAVKNVRLAELNCHVGDRVRASVQGISMMLDDWACII